MEILLFINDNILINISISNLLSFVGYETDICIDGDKAFALAETKKYDLIIADLNLPKYGGNEIIIEIRKRNKEVPIIGMFSVKVDLTEENEKELFAIIPDNIKEEKLLNIIEGALGKRKG